MRRRRPKGCAGALRVLVGCAIWVPALCAAGSGVAWADGSGTASGASGDPGGPSVSVQPDTGLVDGQPVQVAGTGFTPSSQVAVAECRTGASSAADCSAAGATIATAGADGSFTTSFVISRVLSIGGSTLDCANPGACIIGAGQLPSLTTFATTPIAFATTPSVPAPPGSQARYYLALGDSLATGFGAPTGQGYVDDLASFYGPSVGGLDVEDLACNGETSTSFLNGGTCSYPQGNQLAAAEAFLAAHPGQVALITIDIGGDDIAGCASATPPFSISQACVANAISAISTNLATIGAAIRSAAGASVPIAGMTYYDPFVIEWLTGADGQAAAQTSLSDLEQLNAALSTAYASFGARVADVAGAFSTTDFSDQVSSPYGTVPKNVGVACSWLLVLCTTSGQVIVGIHPNATGYGVIASAFEQVVPASSLGQPKTTAGVPPVASSATPTLAFTGFPAMMLATLGLFLVGTGLLILWWTDRRGRSSRREARSTP